MPYGTPIGVVLPVVGGTSDALGEQTILDFLNAVNLVLAAKVTPAGIDINGDLSFVSGVTAYGAVDLLKASFTNQASALAAGANPVALYTVGSNGDLYFNNAIGNQIQVTSGAAVNVSSTGGVTGAGYGVGGVEVNWDSVNTKYRLRSGAGINDFADAELGSLRLNDGSGNFLTINPSGSMASDYAVTFPAALPGAQSIMHVNAAGTINFSNSLANNANLTLSGTGKVVHGTRTIMIPGAGFLPQGGATGSYSVGTYSHTSGLTSVCPIQLEVGSRVVSARLRFVRAGGSNPVGFQLHRQPGGGASTSIASASSSSGGPATMDLGVVNHTVLADNGYFAVMTNLDASAYDAYWLAVDVDDP